jgi:transposase
MPWLRTSHESQATTRALEQEVEKRPVTRRLMTHPGVGPLTALAYELVIGTPERFHCGKQIASYLGLVTLSPKHFVILLALISIGWMN